MYSYSDFHWMGGEDADNGSSMYFTLATFLGSFLGTLGAVVLIITSCRNGIWNSMSRKIILVISFADLLQAASTLLVASIQVYEVQTFPDKYDILNWLGPTGCKWQSAVITVGAMLTFLWTFGLSQHIYLLLKFGIRVARLAYKSLYFLSVTPFVIIGTSFYYDVLGIDERTMFNGNHLSWCWIKVTNVSSEGPFLKQPCPAAMYNGKGFEIFAYLGVTVYCSLAWHQYHHLMKNTAHVNGVSDNSEVQASDSNPLGSGGNLGINRILLIPILFIVCRMWGTISRLSCYCFLKNTICKSRLIYIMQNFFDPLQGFVNFILYKILSSENNCTCNCLTLAHIRPPDQGNSVEPVTIFVNPQSSYSEEY